MSTWQKARDRIAQQIAHENRDRWRTNNSGEEIPGLHYPSPVCTMCWQSVTHDGDGYVCEVCEVRWPDDEDEPGERIDDEGPGETRWPATAEGSGP